ncbi:hypothetical protein HPB49_023064 [Dermacentor silvarum]|uniref:Uncharacterized protein n=1 Tax=Dermacentor silvarum TaxID=543639 RepID=A0ACB8E3P9_DERSI|nr:hypothetical protein HPB49_023064 [Dermacentor silvarum]
MVSEVGAGANCCIMSETMLRELTTQSAQPCSTTLRAFFGHKQTALQKITLPTSCKAQSCLAEFFIVPQNVPVTISGNISERLGLISRVRSVDALPSQDPTAGFGDVFQGLGELKGVTYHIELKPMWQRQASPKGGGCSRTRKTGT